MRYVHYTHSFSTIVYFLGNRIIIKSMDEKITTDQIFYVLKRLDDNCVIITGIIVFNARNGRFILQCTFLKHALWCGFVIRLYIVY